MCFLCRICLLSLLRRPISNSLIWWRLKKMWEFGFGKYTLKLFKTGEQLNHKYRLHRPPIQYSPIWTTLDSIFRKLQVRWNAMLVLHSSHFKYPKLLYLQLHRTYFGVCVCVNEQRERRTLIAISADCHYDAYQIALSIHQFVFGSLWPSFDYTLNIFLSAFSQILQLAHKAHNFA